MALEKDAEARKWNTHAETLTKENSTLKRDLAIAKTTIMTLKAQVEVICDLLARIIHINICTHIF